MADITGFRGLLFNSSQVQMDEVLAPPYDVIDEAGRQELSNKSPYNCVRVILPKETDDKDQKYSDARRQLEEWTSAGILQRDEVPAVYRYHQVFTRTELGENKVIRRGFIAAVRLHDFEEGVILRHERTLKGPKIDRLKLWKSTEAHLSQIFTLYSDPESVIDQAFECAETNEPTLEGHTSDGTLHRLWRVSDPAVIKKVSSHLKGKSLYIADGHHRYETMLAMKKDLLKDAPESNEQSSAQFGMMFLANIDDPGLIVLPTHRMIHSLQTFDPVALQQSLEEYFECREFESIEEAQELLSVLADSSKESTSFAFILPCSSRVRVLKLRSDVDLRDLGLEGCDETLALDVTVLHGLVFEKILGISRAAQEAQSNITYIKDTQLALDRNKRGEGQICFIMNATPVSQVVAVSDANEVMPQKSTFFYPKIASGLVFNHIDVKELL